LDSEPVVPSWKFYDGEIEIFFDAGPHVYYLFDKDGDRRNLDGVTTVLQVINKPFLKAWAAKVCVEYLKEHLIAPNGGLRNLSTEELHILLQEAKGQHKVHLEKAGDIGTLAHDCLEKNIKKAIAENGGVVSKLWFLPDNYIGQTDANDSLTAQYAEKAFNCVQAAFGWMQAHNVRFTHTERKIYSRILDVAGTLDGLALVDSCSDPMCRGCRGRTWKNERVVLDWKSSNQLSIDYALQTAVYLFAHVEEFGEQIGARWVLRLGKESGDFEPWYLPVAEFEGDLLAFESALSLHRSLDAAESRRSAQKREFSEFMRETKKAATAERNRLEKEDKLEERTRAKAEKKALKDQQDAHYKQLRSTGMKAPQAKLIAYAADRTPVLDQMGAEADELGIYDKVILSNDMMSLGSDLTDEAKTTSFVEPDLNIKTESVEPMMSPVQVRSDSASSTSFLEFTVDDADVNLFDFM
jgi:hypothetical protein